ncbi:DUF2927 domain-containing protein [Falsigemmobacter intermedius]|uniref:DUF2927 domain-containing protein n=1 Tax=Falsigemmobacter intermedius TaxID=1553448 RepID=A0A3S3YEI4_9RHOB|nr:DUF2927 domain-containing protein [Falsigemmobacter intermedius]RWY42180.1 DUF2927 domain-containing protein [Falsigemmobacter intermedius]
MTDDGGAAKRLCLAASFLSLTALMACGLQSPQVTALRPSARPEVALPPKPQEPSRESKAVARHFADVEKDLLSRGLLRRDGGGADTPFGPRQIAENFTRIALYDEYAPGGGTLVARETPSKLRRWQAPVRIGLRFGDSVGEAQRNHDRAAVTAYAQRLSKVTGHPVRLSDQNPNFWLYVVSEDERPAMGPDWAKLFPGLDPSELRAATEMPLSTFCLVMAISQGGSPVYTNALAVVRAELPDLMRLACFHEELAQGLGLANDYARARPSIFNDDEEFATLTPLDETLLSLLYDKRLRPGMREAEVSPLLPALISERLPGGS